MIDKTMRAVMFHGPKEIRLEEIPIPSPGPDEILLRISAALTCGTDFKAFRQGHPVLLRSLPAPFGHEFSGTVAKVGEGVTRFPPGTRIVAANSAPCDGCFYCDRDENQLCENMKLLNGAYAEYLLLPANIVKRNSYVIEEGTSFETAALSEPFSCALHAVDVTDVKKGDTVAVIGAGIMARFLLEAVKARGAETIVIGRSPEPLVMMASLGASSTVSILDSDPIAAVKKWTNGHGVDCVFEAVGTAETWHQSIAMVRKGGKVCLFGGCKKGTEVPIDAHRVHYGQLSLYGVFHHKPRYFEKALQLLSTGRISTDGLIEGSIGLDDVPRFFEERHERSNLKSTVTPHA
ncbi:MAG: alcohol dehydrogenase [Elusimicrobia bacterium]|nr:MAG: alcohol dehydrogenase [Elusimicrobiota bacterium]